MLKKISMTTEQQIDIELILEEAGAWGTTIRSRTNC